MNPEVFGAYLLLETLSRGPVETLLARRFHDTAPDSPLFLVTRFNIANLNEDLLKEYFQRLDLIRMNPHQRILAVLEYGFFSGQPFLVQPHIPGTTLQNLLLSRSSSAALEMPAFFFLWNEIAKALQFIHELKDPISEQTSAACHGRLASSSIFISLAGKPFLADFGEHQIDKLMEQHFTLPLATLAIRAPEQWQGKEPDALSDQYFLSVLLWEGLAGRKLFDPQDLPSLEKAKLSDAIPPPSKFNPSIPKTLDALVMRGLSQDPSARFDSVAEFRMDVAKLVPTSNTNENLLAENLKKVLPQLRSEEVARKKKIFSPAGAGTEEITKEITSEEPASEPTLATGAIEHAPFPELNSEPIAAPKNISLPITPTLRKRAPDLVAAQKISSSPYSRILLLALVVVAAGLVGARRVKAGSWQAFFPGKVKVSQNTVSRLEYSESAVESLGEIRLKTEMKDFEVNVNGSGITPNEGSLFVPFDTPLLIRVRKFGYEEISLNAEVRRDQPPPDLQLVFHEAGSVGYLTLVTIPESEVEIQFGKTLAYRGNTPLAKIPLPPGSYQVQAKNGILGLAESWEISIPAEKEIQLEKPLSAKISSP